MSDNNAKIQLKLQSTDPTIKIPISTQDIKIECTSPFKIEGGKLLIDINGGECLLTITHKIQNENFIQGRDFPLNLDLLVKCTWDILVKAPKQFTVIAPGELKRYSRENDDLFHYKQQIPISLSSIQIIRGGFESIRLYNQKIGKEDEEVVVDQSKIDVFFMAKDRKYIQSSCFYLPQVLILIGIGFY